MVTLVRMKSRVHPKYKTRYRVANWPEYEQGLVRRGDVTVWFTPAAVASWKPTCNGKRGGQRRYPDLAIETAITPRLVFHLPLRQTEGFLRSIPGTSRGRDPQRLEHVEHPSLQFDALGKLRLTKEEPRLRPDV
ncbi:MAG: hypothetical protein GY711_23040 [bacterium]|nr:hypothetical protein [bacterium]